uniref:hypothetical protein n=1 Tax=Serratia liquefaciens TaxID=614 RepID=UPI001F4C0C68|nr:hypothetical protein [Serratia liquefaciens]
MADTGTGRFAVKGTLRRLTPPFAAGSTSRLCAAASTPPLSASLIPRPGLCATAPDSPRRQKAKRGIHQKEACYG